MGGELRKRVVFLSVKYRGWSCMAMNMTNLISDLGNVK